MENSLQDYKLNSINGGGRGSDVSAVRAADDRRLAELGYKSEFKRNFSLLDTIGFAFSVLGVTGAISGTFSFLLISGGHVGMVFGWLIPSLFVMCIVACLAELSSSMPTSAGLYYFAAKMAPPKYAALASWITGWANMTGQIALVSSIDYACALMISTAIAVNSDGRVVLGAGPTIGIMAAVMFIHGLIASAATKVFARLNFFFVAINVGTLVAVIVTLFVCSGENKVSAKDAFTLFENNSGWRNDGWAFLLSFISPMWSITGYDSAVHLSEEVNGAARAVPIAILVGVGASVGLGWIFLIAASFATVSVPNLLTSVLPLPMGQLLSDVVGKKGMLALWSCIIIVVFAAGVAQLVDASRTVFAFARDRALPGSRWWRRINSTTQTPVNAVWLVVVLAAILGLLGFSSAALSSLAGVSVIGLYVSYAAPIFLRITSGRNKFEKGPFSLGRWYMAFGIISVAWICFITVLLLFPGSQSLSSAGKMNYAVVTVLGVFFFASASWVLSARKWFIGPVKTVESEDEAEKSYIAPETL